ncbi:MAG: sugar dehydrogenase, partial [Hydrococcus sp. RM1_1_31]|nr:sugar dehydrogenase [Hydrococcus sp. RM1_1_31]
MGQAIAIRFASEGANVAINYRNNPEKAEETQAEIDRICDRIRGCSAQ